jgi:hypothetical protein
METVFWYNLFDNLLSMFSENSSNRGPPRVFSADPQFAPRRSPPGAAGAALLHWRRTALSLTSIVVLVLLIASFYGLAPLHGTRIRLSRSWWLVMKRRIPAGMLVKWPSDRLSDRPGLVDRARQYAVGAGLAAAARTARAAAVAAPWSSLYGVCSCGSSSIGYSLLHSTEPRGHRRACAVAAALPSRLYSQA